MTKDPRYPIGPFTRPDHVTREKREEWIRALEQAPAGLAAAVAGLEKVHLETPYRDGGWTVRQVVHHVADSHMHSYIRCKFALSMDNPTIMPYDEVAWSQFDDGEHEDVATSLQLLTSLHARWVRFLRSLDET